MLIRFLMGFASFGLFAGLAILGLAFNVLGFDLPALGSVDWRTAGWVALTAGTLGGLLAVIRELMASRRPLVGHTLGEGSETQGASIWDWFPW